MSATAADLALLADEVEDDLRSTLRRLLAARATPQRVAACYDGDDSVGADVWSGLVELGLTGLLVPEEHGGAGAGATEAAAVLDELGRACSPAPYLSSAVVATTVLASLRAGDLLGELAEGLVAALLAPVTAHRIDHLVPLTLSADGTVSGEVRSVVGVVGGAPAGLLLVPVNGARGPALVAVRVPDEAVTLTPVVSLDMSSPLADVRLDGAAAVGIDGDAHGAVANGLATGATLVAADLVGVATWCLEATVAYLGERRQFGRVVGGYQALKHRLADLYCEVEQATATARYAAAAIVAGDADGAVATAVAKSWCSDVAVHAAEEAVQLHGGLGMTWEHPCHLHLKRAKAGASTLGSPTAHRDDLAVLVDLPPPTTDQAGSTSWT